MKFVVLGDLHLDSRESEAFERARADVCALEPKALVCLGDLGSGAASGTRDAFERARDYLASFEVANRAILGNHDLERIDAFASDADAVACFSDVFGLEAAYGTIELGDALGVLLSSTGFRDNRGYKHEVSIDAEQFDWLRTTLRDNRSRPTIIFSHAPPLGSHLRVLQYPHLRAGNAWLNQSNAPGRFLPLLNDNPQVRLWFSGHNHLGQHYQDSASLVGRCLFVHTGVIGGSSRDGAHHSRVVCWDGDTIGNHGEIRIDTFDHAEHRVIDDVRFDLKRNHMIREVVTEAESGTTFFPAPRLDAIPANNDIPSVGGSAFAVHRDMLVEYDVELRDPVGVVEDWLGRTRVTTRESTIVLRSLLGSRRITPSDDGYYFQIPSRNRRILNELREAFARRLKGPGV